MDNEEAIEPQDDGLVVGNIEANNENVDEEIVSDSVENSGDESDNNSLIPNGYHDAEVESSDDETDEDVPLQPRILLAGLGAVLGHDQRIDDSSSGDEGDNDVERERFDSELPGRHTYLGEGKEVCGRTILDDEFVQSLPLFSQPGLA